MSVASWPPTNYKCFIHVQDRNIMHGTKRRYFSQLRFPFIFSHYLQSLLRHFNKIYSIYYILIFFFCNAIDNSFVIPKIFFIKCRAKTNSKDRIDLIIDRVSTFWSDRPSSSIILSTSTIVEDIKIKFRIVPYYDPQRVSPGRLRFVSWFKPCPLLTYTIL